MDSPATKIVLHAPPVGVRINPQGMEPISARVVEQQLTEAFERGRRESEEQSTARAAELLDQAAQRLEAAFEASQDEIARFAVELACAAASRLLCVEIDAGRHDMERMMRETLAHSGVDRGTCVVHVHPLDMELLAGVSLRSGTLLEPDPALERGDVHVTTPQGLLVRELETCLATLRERIIEGAP